MDYPRFILVGDLKFTVSSSEIWRPQARLDLLSDFFLEMIGDAELIDLISNPVQPTWTNGRVGKAGI